MYEIMHVKCSVQGPAHSECLIYRSCYYRGKSEESGGDEFFIKAAFLPKSEMMRAGGRAGVEPWRPPVVILHNGSAV